MNDQAGSRDPYFFCAELPSSPVVVTLGGDEGRHAFSVRRLRSGDAITLFDGHGNVGSGEVGVMDARRKTLEVHISSVTKEPAPRPLTLAAALPKGERLAVMLDMATQLGMTRFAPLDCERSVVKVSENARKRWQRICLEACKQSRRAWLPKLAQTSTVANFSGHAGDAAPVWIAHPGGCPVDEALRSGLAPAAVMIGPEGGFTPREVESATARGAVVVSLGAAVLRLETAALACLAMTRLGRQAQP